MTTVIYMLQLWRRLESDNTHNAQHTKWHNSVWAVGQTVDISQHGTNAACTHLVSRHPFYLPGGALINYSVDGNTSAAVVGQLVKGVPVCECTRNVGNTLPGVTKTKWITSQALMRGLQHAYSEPVKANQLETNLRMQTRRHCARDNAISTLLSIGAMYSREK